MFTCLTGLSWGEIAAVGAEHIAQVGGWFACVGVGVSCLVIIDVGIFVPTHEDREGWLADREG